MQHIPLNQGLTASMQELIGDRLIYKFHRRGSSFYFQNESADRMFIIEHGEVNLFDAKASSNVPQVLHDYHAFGDISMITGANHSVTAIAAEDTTGVVEMVINLLRGCAKTSGWMDLVGYAYFLPKRLARSINHSRSRRWRSHAAVWIFVSALIVVLDDALAVEPTPSRNQGVDGIPVTAVPTFDCADVIGKVFDDSNLNGYQDEAEVGIPSVKLVTTQGLEARTDQNGRFHITCALSPNPDRGSNFIIKLDARSLPIGYRLTTENPRVVRATPGKVLKFDFGAAIHRRVRLDLADAVFERDSSQIRKQWLSHVDLLMDRLEEGPAVLCLAYMADFEELTLVTERLLAIKKEINQRWADLDCCYKLDIETRIIWRGRTSTD